MSSPFEVVQFLGKGEYGLVDLVRRRSDARLFIMKKSLIHTKEELERETVIVKHLFQYNNSYCHPNVTCYASNGYDPIDRTYFLLLALNGLTYEPKEISTLFDFLRNNQFIQLTEYDRMKLTYQLITGVLFIHGAGVAHMDLTISNIIVQKDERGYNLYIIDFGLGCGVGYQCESRHSLDWKRISLVQAQEKDWESVGESMDLMWRGLLRREIPPSKISDFIFKLKYMVPVPTRERISSFCHDIDLWLRQNAARSSLRQLQRRLTIRD